MLSTFQCDTLQRLHAAYKVKGVAKDVVAPAHEHHGRQRVGMQHGCHHSCPQTRATLCRQCDISPFLLKHSVAKARCGDSR